MGTRTGLRGGWAARSRHKQVKTSGGPCPSVRMARGGLTMKKKIDVQEEYRKPSRPNLTRERNKIKTKGNVQLGGPTRTELRKKNKQKGGKKKGPNRMKKGTVCTGPGDWGTTGEARRWVPRTRLFQAIMAGGKRKRDEAPRGLNTKIPRKKPTQPRVPSSKRREREKEPRLPRPRGRKKGVEKAERRQ